MTTARDKAERCFALARSTTFDGERANAIAQGTRIAEAAGLSLDLFDIPGRVRSAAPKPAPSSYADDLFRPSKAPRQYTAEEVDDAFRRFEEQMRANMATGSAFRAAYERERNREAAWQSAHAKAQREAERAAEQARQQREDLKAAVDEALARNREAMERIHVKEREGWASLADKVANALWPLGWRVYQDADGEDGRRRWHVTSPTGATFEDVDDERLCGIGMEHGAVDAIAEDLRKRAEAARPGAGAFRWTVS